MRELTLLYAPNINSYKRYQPGSFAPTAVRWGVDNRTCALRLVGHGPVAAGGEPGARRRRQPVPGGRRAWSPARCTASSSELPLEDGVHRQRLRRRGRAARAGDAARRAGAVGGQRAWPGAAFGDEVVDHYANNARVELAAFDAAVTDWELFRGFERL